MSSMILQNASNLGTDAIRHPKKYNALMGISILYKYFSKKRMQYFFEWSSSLFNKVIFINIDDPYRYNFKVFQPIGETEALSKARKISAKLKTGYLRLLKQLNLNNIKIVQFADFIHEDKYKVILSKIHKHYSTNEQFRKNLLKQMIKYIGGKLEETHKNTPEIRSYLVNYLIEEIAAILFFTENGYRIEFDPDVEIPTKKILYEGHLDNIYSDLNLSYRGYIQIYPEGQPKSIINARQHMPHS